MYKGLIPSPDIKFKCWCQLGKFVWVPHKLILIKKTPCKFFFFFLLEFIKLNYMYIVPSGSVSNSL